MVICQQLICITITNTGTQFGLPKPLKTGERNDQFNVVFLVSGTVGLVVRVRHLIRIAPQPSQHLPPIRPPAQQSQQQQHHHQHRQSQQRQQHKSAVSFRAGLAGLARPQRGLPRPHARPSGGGRCAHPQPRTTVLLLPHRDDGLSQRRLRNHLHQHAP